VIFITILCNNINNNYYYNNSGDILIIIITITVVTFYFGPVVNRSEFQRFIIAFCFKVNTLFRSGGSTGGGDRGDCPPRLQRWKCRPQTCKAMFSSAYVRRSKCRPQTKMATHAVRSPCFSDALNLCLARSSSVQCVRNSVGTIKDVVSFFNARAKRNSILKRIAGKQLQSLCETRWVERHDAILLFYSELAAIVKSAVITNWTESASASKASSLKLVLCSCEFIVTLFCLSDVLSLTLSLSTKLQTVGVNFFAAKTAVIYVIAVWTKRREAFDNFRQYFCLCVSHDGNARRTRYSTSPRITKSQRNQLNPPASTPNEFYRRTVGLYLPLLDAITTDLRSRFSDFRWRHDETWRSYLFCPFFSNWTRPIWYLRVVCSIQSLSWGTGRRVTVHRTAGSLEKKVVAFELWEPESSYAIHSSCRFGGVWSWNPSYDAQLYWQYCCACLSALLALSIRFQRSDAWKLG